MGIGVGVGIAAAVAVALAAALAAAVAAALALAVALTALSMAIAVALFAWAVAVAPKFGVAVGVLGAIAGLGAIIEVVVGVVIVVPGVFVPIPVSAAAYVLGVIANIAITESDNKARHSKVACTLQYVALSGRLRTVINPPWPENSLYSEQDMASKNSRPLLPNNFQATSETSEDSLMKQIIVMKDTPWLSIVVE